MTTLLLSAYPLSRAYRDALEAKAACAMTPVPLLELRQRGVLRMARELRGLVGEQLYVACEDASSRALLPVLQIIAVLPRVRRRFVADEQLDISSLRLLGTVRGAVGMMLGTAKGLASCVLSMLSLRRLKTAERLQCAPNGRRALYLNANLWFGVKAGGSVGHISGVVNALSREGYDVLFCSAGGRLMVEDAVKFEQLRPPRAFGLPWPMNTYTFDWSVGRQVAPLAKRHAPAFIYQRLSVGNHTGVRLSRRLGVPLVLEYNGSEVWVARNWGRRLAFEAVAQSAEDVCLRHAHLVVTVSDVLRDELLARGVEAARIVTYPNCIDERLFDPSRFSDEERSALRRRYGIEPDATVVAFLGSFGPWHGVPVLARAIRKLIDGGSAWLDKHRVRFLLIGDGAQMGEVRSILGAHASGPYVRLAGLVPQDSAPLHLAAADIVSSPHVPNADGTPFFGSPTKLFEYMAMGNAIVASDLDQIGVVLRRSLCASQLPISGPEESDRLAILCQPGSAEEQVQGIRFLVENPAWRHTLGANARAEALLHYTWSRHVRQFLDRFR